MSELDALLLNASDNTEGVFRLSPETQSVLFFALSLAQNLNLWKDTPNEDLSDTTIDEIFELLDWANDELMREVEAMPVGAMVFWAIDTIPDGWLWCDGGFWLKTEYPELYALWGEKYGGNDDNFALPDLRNRSPYGAGNDAQIGLTAGSETHTLTVDEIPAHGHNIRIGSAAGTGAHPHANNNQANQSTSYAAIADTGGGQAHNNLHPVFYGYWLVYAGRYVAP